MAIEVSPFYTRPNARMPGTAHAEILSWRVALSLIVNGSVVLWAVIGKAVLLLVP